MMAATQINQTKRELESVTDFADDEKYDENVASSAGLVLQRVDSGNGETKNSSNQTTTSNSAASKNANNNAASTVNNTSAATKAPERIVLKKDDIDFLMRELEWTRVEAEKHLKEHKGSLDQVIKSFLA